LVIGETNTKQSSGPRPDGGPKIKKIKKDGQCFRGKGVRRQPAYTMVKGGGGKLVRPEKNKIVEKKKGNPQGGKKKKKKAGGLHGGRGGRWDTKGRKKEKQGGCMVSQKALAGQKGGGNIGGRGGGVWVGAERRVCS